MRGLLFISLLLGLGYVAYLQMTKIKEHDLDKAETQIDQTREQVNELLEQHRQQIQNLPE